MPATAGLTLHQVLEQLDYASSEHLSINTQAPGGRFTSYTHPSSEIALLGLPQDRDVWFSVNPVRPGPRGRRGGADDVTRLAALWVDLDVKPGGCADLDVARSIIDVLADMLGTRPVVNIYSGHGLQPLWPIDHHPLDTEDARADARVLLRRWGRLVAHVAEQHHAAVDSVFDLARILRAPGSINHKTTPVAVLAVPDTGHPIDVDQVLEQLDAYGAVEQPGDRDRLDTPISNPAEWAWADRTCTYARQTIKGWASEQPAARHPWLVAQTVRLAAMHAHGCLTQADHQRALAVLTDRFGQLLATGNPVRKPGVGEIRDAITWGTARAATMPPERIGRELGAHSHEPPATEATLTLIPGPAAGDPPAPTEGAAPVNGATALHINQPDSDLPRKITVTLTDSGNSELFVAQHADRFRYVPARGAWLQWDGHRWAWCDDDSQAIEAATATIHAIAGRNDDVRKHKARSLSRRGLEATVSLARRNSAIRLNADQLDADPLLLNTPSGIVNLDTGQLSPCAPNNLCTRLTGVDYDPHAKAPRWQQFLHETFDGDSEVIDFAQRLAGYSATGIVTHHVLPFLFGQGGNGKTVFLETIVPILGDYATTTPSNFLMVNAREDESAIARLAGYRMVVCSEVNQNSKFNEAKLKHLTGGDRITARFLYGRHFTFTPSHKLWLMGNHQPKVEAGGESFWRRLRLIPFTNKVPDERKIKGLDKQLVADEGPGILAWIIQGARHVLANGLGDPVQVMAATKQYAAEEDALGRFITDRCRIVDSPLVRTNTAKVRAAYTAWCQQEDERELSPQVFGRELKTRFGIESERSHGQRFYIGFDLGDDPDDDPDSDPELRWDQR